MKNMKKLIAIGLSLIMVALMAACGNTDNAGTGSGTGSGTPSVADPGAQQPDTTTPSTTPSTTGGKRVINVGTWWVPYYDSSHESVEDDPTFSGLDVAYRKFDVVKKIEDKYNVELYFQNLTYAGTKESLTNSVLAGSPDCDIYLVELSFGIPAALNGLAIDLRTVLPADDDLFTTQTNARFVDLGDGKACIIKRVEAASTVEATYPLAFNLQMIQDNNLERPDELYAKGQWTWDKFIEYCKVLTQDTDGDGQIDQYGYCGFVNETFEQLMMSNGANVASGKKEMLTDSKTGEVLKMISDMYNVDNVCYPYDFDGNDSDTMRRAYHEGTVGFFPIAAWIASDGPDYGADGKLEFDTVYVQWPVGPSGDAATNAGKVTSGEFYVIPAGVEDPELVYNVLYDYWNWYDGDTSIRDDYDALAWWYTVTGATEAMQEHNFGVMFEVGSRETFDLWNSLGFDYDFKSLIDGSVTPAQFQETYKQQVQDALDAFFK